MRRPSITLSLVLLILAAALPVMALYAWSAIEQRNQVIAAAEDQLLRSAKLVASQQQSMFTNAGNLLSTLLVAATEIGVQDPKCGQLADRIASENRTYEALAVVLQDGTVVCKSSSDEFGENVGDLGVFGAAATSQSLSIGMPQDGMVPIATTARAASGDTQLIGLAMVRFEELETAMSLARLPEGGVAVLFDSDLNILAQAPEGTEIDSALIGAVTPAAAPSSGGAGLVSAVSNSGDRFLWAVTDFLPDQGLFIALGVDYGDLLAGEDRELRQGLGVLLAVFLLAAMAAWFVGQRTIQRPIARLAAAVGALKRGDGSDRSEVAGASRELRQLSVDFNEMADSLRARETDIKERSDQLAQMVGEREILVHEMNHRVRNSLQLVSSIVGLQIGNLSDDDAKVRLREAQSRIAAISKVHEQLYSGSRLDRVAVAPYLTDLCDDLARSLALDERNVKLTVDALDFELPPDRMIPLGMIITELVTNSAKHAMNGAAGTISLAVNVDGDEVVASVCDFGAGLPQEVHSGESTGLGLRIVNALARQLNAEVTTERTGQGLRTTIRFSRDRQS